MLPFGTEIPQDAANQWRFQLDQFVQGHQTALAAIAWGLRQEWQDPQQYLGLDLDPSPHFIRCTYDDLERLNLQVNRQIQEIIGILGNHNPETEVAILAIAQGQFKLIYFQPAQSPARCFDQWHHDLDAVLTDIETRLNHHFLRP